MQINTPRWSSIVLLLLIGCASEPPPPQQEVGGMLPPVTIEDQHGVAHTLDDSLRLVLMSRDMEAGAIIRAALAETGPDALERSGAIYISDISAMPGVIARLIAIPKMRERAYPVLLDRDGQLTASFPAEPEKVTVLRVQRRKIRKIRYVGEVSEMVKILGGPGAGRETP